MPVAFPSTDDKTAPMAANLKAEWRGRGRGAPHDTTSNASRAPALASSSMLVKSPLAPSGLMCIISYLASNSVVDGASSSSNNTQERGEGGDGHVGGSSSVGEAFVSAESLFLQATQAPSAAAISSTTTTATSASALGPSQSSSATAGIITRPLALLAASPRCRRAMEEHLAGGCLLSPMGSLILQVRRRDAVASGPTLYRLAAASTSLEREKHAHARQWHQKHSSKQRALRSAEALEADECAQQLVVTSTNVPLSVLPFQTISSVCSPARSPVQRRPLSAREHLLLPRQSLVSPTSSSLASLPHTPRRSPSRSLTALASPSPPPRASAGRSAVAAAVERSPSRDIDGPPTPQRADTSAGGLPSIAAATSPVVQSRRMPMGALLGAAAAAAQTFPPLSPSSPLPTTAIAIAPAAAAAAAPGSSNIRPFRRLSLSSGVLPTTSDAAAYRDDVRSGPQPWTSTPPLRPDSFPFLSPRPLPLSTAAGAPPSSYSTPPPPPPSSVSSSCSALPVPPALQALCRAWWWLRRGPLPVSLSLLRYTEADVQALWSMLRAEAITAGEGENLQGERSRGFACERKGGSAERSTAHPTDSDTPDSKRPTRRRSDHVDTHVTPTAAPAPPSPSTTASKHDRSSVLPPAAALPSVLPSPVTELYVHGGAASTALASLLPGHPEVRAVRLTHAALSPTQLRDLARYCPDVTRLSLAMNDDLHSTSFLCPTPSDTSSPTNTTATNTTTTTKMFSTAQQSQHPSPLLPPPPLPPTGNTHSPRSAFFVSKSAGPPPPGEAHVIPAPPPCGNGAAADEQRGGLLRPPPLSLSLPLPPPPAAATVASARSPDVPTARSSDSFTVDADDDQNTQSVRSNLADGTVHSRSTQAPPLQLPVQQRQVLLPLRRASQDALHNSQIDLFAAEEEGEAEMRMSLWQAAQTDVAERRQAVFILRPSDVVLGDAGEEGDDGGGDKGTKDSCLAAPAPSPPPPLSSSRPQNSANTVGGGVLPNSDGAVLAAATAAAAEKEEKEGETQPRPPLSFLLSASDDDASAVASTDTAAPLPPLSLSASTQHTDPLRLPDAVSRSVDATLAEMRTSLGKRSARTTSAYKGGVRIATATNASLPAATATATATTPSAASHARLRHRRSSSPRKGSSTHWSETLIDLDLSYTQVRDVSAARDVPQLQMLSRLSLEGCMQLTRVRWLPSLQHLRELNLSFSSVQGSAMYPLGFCARLEWLKLEGCSSFTCIDQLWVTAEVPKDESPSLQTDQRTLESTTGTTRATEQLSSAHLVRHRIAGGIPAITVLPASASRLASFSVATSDRGEDEAGTAPADTSPSTTPTASSAGAARPSPPPPSSGVSDAIDAAAAGAAEAAPAPLLSTLRVLIATSTGLTDAGLRPLRHIESLECVVVDRCAALTDINVAAELPALHTLDASHTGVTTSGLSALRHSRTLRLLRLQGCLSLTRLPVLFVEPTSARTGTAVSAGAGGGGGDDGNGGRASRVTAPRLSVIDVSLCSNLSAGGVEGLVMDAAAVQLEEAAATAATDGHRGQPAPTIEANSGGKPAHRDASLPLPLPYALPQLRHLFLRSCDALSQLTALRGFTRVVELDLYHTNIDAAALTTATAWWTSLEVLNVASTRVCTLAAWCPAEDMRGERKADGGALGGCADPVEGNHRPATGADASPTALPDADFLTTSKLPLFACTLRVLTLSNTDVTADGLRALQHFPRVEVLQLSSCRRLTSLSFLCLRADAPEVREGGGRMKERVALQEEQQLQQQRTALRELTVTEAVELTNVTTFPYLAACPRLRVLSLSGCTQLGGGGDAPSASATSAAPARPLTEHLPPLVGTITSNSNCSAKDSSFAVLQRMSGLTDLNLSKTAVTHDDLRAVLMPPSMRAVESLQANAASPADRATTRSPYSPLPHPQPASTSLQRIWLRGCRHLDEDGLLAAAAAAAVSEAEAAAAANGNATGTSGVFPQEKNTHVFLASVREVFLSQGRFGAAVLSSLVPRCVE